MTKALLKEILFLAVVILLFSTSCFFIHLNGSQNGGNVNTENGLRKKHFPAPWLKSSRRKVLFVELYTNKKYYGKGKFKTGEYYISSTWDLALQSMNFEVHRVSTKEYYERMSKEDLAPYHRIFVRDPKFHHLYEDNHDILCRVRPLFFYGEWEHQKNDFNYRYEFPFHEKQIVTAHKDDVNSFLGYFPHNLLEDSKVQNKKKSGLLYGKKAEYFQGFEEVFQRLLDAGFELHSTCQDTEDQQCPFPEGVLKHGPMKPEAFAHLMTEFSFVIGFRKPEVKYIHVTFKDCVAKFE